MTSPTHHSEYYFDDGSLVIQVENTLFNVFRSTFTSHSRVFRDVFSLPKPTAAPGHPVEGECDECPLRFSGISCVDFERLLWILYPPHFGAHKPSTAAEWTSILHLSTRWEFDDIRSLAIRELERIPLGSVDKILLSKEYDIQSPWALDAYTEVCQRQEALTLDEGKALGLETSIRISQLRERLRFNSIRRSLSPSASPTRRGTFPPVHSASLKTRKSIGAVPTLPRHKSISKLSDTSRLIASAFGLADVRKDTS